MRLKLPWLLGGLLLGACSGAHDAPAQRAVSLLEGERGARFSRAAWLDGESWLEVGVHSGGRVRVEVTFEGGEQRTLLDVPGGGAEVLETLALPGEGPRAIRFDLSTEGESQWHLLRLVSTEAPPLPPGERLAQDLAGRDVLVIVTDSTHAEHLSCYGHDRNTSPALDRLAAEGVRFEAAYSQTAWTLPSVASIFTSVEQERHGLVRMSQRLGEELTTLSEAFQAAGYRTAGIIQNGVVGKGSGLSRGFDLYEVSRWTPERTDRLMAKAQQMLLAPRAEPLFLYLHLTPPHQPYEPPVRYRELFVDPDYSGDADGSFLSCATVDKFDLPPDHPDVRHISALYDAHVSYIDAQIGKLIEAVRGERGDELLIVITSDHGEAFMQHGKMGHNVHVYEEMIHVPLVIVAPGSCLSPGRVVETPVSLLDVMPTLIDLCGLDEPRQVMRGGTLAGLLQGAEAENERLMFMTSRYTVRGEPDYAVRVGRHKFLSHTGGAALYDLVSDPGETQDRSADHPVLVQALQAEYERWYAYANQQRARVTQARPSAARDEAIRELGYGGDEADED